MVTPHLGQIGGRSSSTREVCADTSDLTPRVKGYSAAPAMRVTPRGRSAESALLRFSTVSHPPSAREIASSYEDDRSRRDNDRNGLQVGHLATGRIEIQSLAQGSHNRCECDAKRTPSG